MNSNYTLQSCLLTAVHKSGSARLLRSHLPHNAGAAGLQAGALNEDAPLRLSEGPKGTPAVKIHRRRLTSRAGVLRFSTGRSEPTTFPPCHARADVHRRSLPPPCGGTL